MSKDQKIFIFTLLFVAACGNLFFASKIKAETDSLGTILSERELNLGASGTFVLTQRLNKNQKIWILTETDSWKKHNLVLDGFEDDITQCSQPVNKITTSTVVCLKGIVGVHSQNYIFFDPDNLRIVTFVGGDSFDRNIYSDVPLATMRGKTFTIDRRNYDADPIKDAARYTFQFSDGKFVFDKKNNITYDDGNNNITGAL